MKNRLSSIHCRSRRTAPRVVVGLAAAWVGLVTLSGVSRPVGAMELDSDESWSDVSSKGHSIVFGRFEGQFDGPQFRGRKLKVRHTASGEERELEVGAGRGFFEEVVRPGDYEITGVEATYFPRGGPITVRKFRPVRQRFWVTPKEGEEFPRFHVPSDRPVYVGTIRAEVSSEGIIYSGHRWRVFDEYEDAMERLEFTHPRFVASLTRRHVEPLRDFVLGPSFEVDEPEELEFIGVDDPIQKARAYLEEGKYRQAVHWLGTFMPTSDAERSESMTLMGEALLAQGRYEDAIERLGEVLEADPRKLRALRLLARAHALNGSFADATGLYEALTDFLPDDTEGHLQLGYLYALRREPQRSAEAFSLAFRHDTDYLLHDGVPYVVALKAAEGDAAEYDPPALTKQIPVPSAIRSRRSAEETTLSLLIDHEGKVIAAQVSPEGSGPLPVMLTAIVRATFQPAVLNGVPVPAVLRLPGGGGSDDSR